MTRIRTEMKGFKGDECQCGRRFSIMHCTKCGSVRVYARQNRQHNMMNGTVQFVDIQYRCQTCGKLFIEAEREWCDAPPVGDVLGKRKALAMMEAAASGERSTMSEAEQKMLEAVEPLLRSENAQLLNPQPKEQTPWPNTPEDQVAMRKALIYDARKEHTLLLVASLEGGTRPPAVAEYINAKLREIGLPLLTKEEQGG